MLQVTSSAPFGELRADHEWLKVIEWSDTQIIAVDDSAICLTSQTIFDLKGKTVIALDIRKPNVPDIKLCTRLPDRQTYYLQDEANYYLQKAVGTLPKPH